MVSEDVSFFIKADNKDGVSYVNNFGGYGSEMFYDTEKNLEVGRQLPLFFITGILIT